MFTLFCLVFVLAWLFIFYFFLNIYTHIYVYLWFGHFEYFGWIFLCFLFILDFRLWIFLLFACLLVFLLVGKTTLASFTSVGLGFFPWLLFQQYSVWITRHTITYVTYNLLSLSLYQKLSCFQQSLRSYRLWENSATFKFNFFSNFICH